MIGKWNKSVILTYIGMSISILGIILVLNNIDIKYTFICFMLAGICDLFDGTIARRCKRTKEEKMFGIELDSLVDVISFITLQIVILGTIVKSLYIIPIIIIYSIFGIARLAHFNITTPNNNKAVKYYEGLPVTYAALIFPITYLLSYVIKENIFIIIYSIVTLLVSILFIIKIKVPKPKLKASILLLLLSIIITIIYIFV